MQFNNTIRIPLALALACVSISAWSAKSDNDEKTKARPSNTSVAEFLAYQKVITKEVNQGKYGDIPRDELQLLADSQATLRTILGEVEDVSDLKPDEKINVYTAQEAIKSVLMDNVDNRPICRRRHTVGTHRKVTECFTRQQKSLMQQRAEDVMTFWPRVQPELRN